MRWLLMAGTRRRGSRMPRRARAAVITGMTALLVPLAGIAPAAQAAAAAGPARLLPVAAGKLIPVHPVPAHPVKVPEGRPWHLPPASWPAAGTATVPAVAAAPAGRTSPAMALASAG